MAETIDQQFIEYIVKTLVSNPDKVKVNRSIDERGVLLELYVEPEDLGRVIGRNGATAKSIRTLLRALGVKNDARYNLKIVDTNSGEGHREREPRREEAEQPVPEEPPTEVANENVDSQETPQEEPAAEPEAEAEPEASNLDRHRQDIKDITGDLEDI